MNGRCSSTDVEHLLGDYLSDGRTSAANAQSSLGRHDCLGRSTKALHHPTNPFPAKRTQTVISAVEADNSVLLLKKLKQTAH
jgi:hypothetical protein